MLQALGEVPVSTIPKPLDQLYESHHAMVFRTAHRITGNAADAEDVVQTVFLRMVKRDSTETIENPESYLRRSAVNAALDIVRARQADNTLELERIRVQRIVYGAARIARYVAARADQVASAHAEMFALRFFEGYTNPEIAKLMGFRRWWWP